MIRERIYTSELYRFTCCMHVIDETDRFVCVSYEAGGAAFHSGAAVVPVLPANGKWGSGLCSTEVVIWI